MSITELRGKIGQTKVKRYWPGKAPEWAKEAEEDHDNVKMHKVNDDLGFCKKDDDPRLRRLAQTTRTENREEVKADHRRIRQAEIMWAEEELRNQETIDEVEEDEDDLEERRRRIREKNLNRAQEETEEDELEDEEEEDEEEESEYESDWEEDRFGITMIKPVFVRKPERDTITERERIEAEEEALEELAKRKLEMRKIETKQIVVEEVRKYEENMLLEEDEKADIGDVETDDEIDQAEEYKVWMTREFARIKRERDDPKEEIEKLRNNPKDASLAQPKKKRKFVRKYYHKGAFFQTDDGIFHRDFSAPTEQDRLNNSIGRSGRTKWTHLLNEDTTIDWSNPRFPKRKIQLLPLF